MQKPTNPPASALADQFQVTELEPRLENGWGVDPSGPPVEHPGPIVEPAAQ